jgi:pyrroline-5-carboxylate reductase
MVRPDMKIAIIGSGNIGAALVTGLLREGSIAPGNISLSDISPKVLAPFATKGVRNIQNNADAATFADILVLCVKPYHVRSVIEEILPSLTSDTLLVSLAAGVTIDQLTQMVGSKPLFRAIPNTAMAVCQSMTCIAPSSTVNSEQINSVTKFFSFVGQTLFIDESLMNAATVIASCGTAFALRYLRASMTASVEIGFRPAVAEAIIAQTMLGAAVLVSEAGVHPEVEIDKATTPKGITIRGLNEMEHAGFSSAVMQGILTAYDVLKE